MSDALVLSIADDFSPFPAGRVEEDGPFNGEKFRKKFLVPGLKSAAEGGRSLEVSLDGLKSCGSSFLESAFGGLVRYEKYTEAQLNDLLRIAFHSPSLERYKLAIERHIGRAKVE